MRTATFQKVKLGDLVKIKGGKRLPLGHELTNKRTAHPYIRARDIGGGKITFDDPVYVDENAFLFIKNYIVNSNDVCITIVGANVGDIGFVPTSLDGANLTENAVRLFPKDNNLDRRFLKYCLLTNEIKLQMEQLAGGGAAQPKLGLYKIKDLEIPHPTIENQICIASILSVYDDLIENNEKRMRILEEMSQRLYTEWFVKFKFPGHKKVRMIDSGTDFGKIPEGWEVKRLKDVVSFLEGPGLRNWQYRDAGVPFLNIRTIGNGDIDIEKCNYLDYEEVNQKYPHFLLKENDIVISSSGTLGRLAVIRKKHLPLCLNTSVIRFREIKDGLPIWFIKQYLLSEIFQNKIRSLASGSAQLNYGPSHLSTINLIMPNSSILNAYNKKAAHLEIKNCLLKDHISNLSKTRDLLIPQLVTGKRELRY